jgi:hypothetical protein
VGKGKDSLVNSFDSVPGNFIKKQRQDNGYGELDEESPKTDKAGIPEGPEKKGSRKNVLKVLKIIPGASRNAFGIIKSFENQLDAVNGKIGKNNIKSH